MQNKAYSSSAKENRTYPYITSLLLLMDEGYETEQAKSLITKFNEYITEFNLTSDEAIEEILKNNPIIKTKSYLFADEIDSKATLENDEQSLQNKLIIAGYKFEEANELMPVLINYLDMGIELKSAIWLILQDNPVENIRNLVTKGLISTNELRGLGQEQYEELLKSIPMLLQLNISFKDNEIFNQALKLKSLQHNEQQMPILCCDALLTARRFKIIDILYSLTQNELSEIFRLSLLVFSRELDINTAATMISHPIVKQEFEALNDDYISYIMSTDKGHHIREDYEAFKDFLHDQELFYQEIISIFELDYLHRKFLDGNTSPCKSQSSPEKPHKVKDMAFSIEAIEAEENDSTFTAPLPHIRPNSPCLFKAVAVEATATEATEETHSSSTDLNLEKSS